MEKYCQNCKQPNPADASFCRQCASPLPPTQAGQQAPPNQGQQWNPQGGGFQQGAGNFAAQADKASPRAIASLCLAIASLVLCCGPLTAIPAAILGWMESSAIKQGQSSAKGLVMAQIGLWGGIVMSVLGILVGVGYFFLIILAAASGGR